jgi:uroporphyrinogen decarboxylase
MPDLVEAGLQIFNPFQPETMDIFETKKRYYGRLAFYGGISIQHLLPHGTPDEVRKETRRLLNELGDGGGYIASPSHEVPPDVPPENLAAMIEVLQNQ